jgi:dCTP deaminase
MLNTAEIGKLVSDNNSGFRISPLLGFDPNKTAGTASIDLRLGCWFIQLRTERCAGFDFGESHRSSEDFLTTKSFVPFGKGFVLHPHSFVLAATLEWIKLPNSLGGYVNGKSSLGRRGLVIETAPGVHPMFLGCLTLELANVGEVPLTLHPGMPICQLFLHRITSLPSDVAPTRFRAERQPRLGAYTVDPIAAKLKRP